VTAVSTVLAVLCIASLVGCTVAPARFEFAVIGDQQYSAASEAQFSRLLEAIDRANVAFVVHVGAFKASRSSRCDDPAAEPSRNCWTLAFRSLSAHERGISP
jgi:hypothetical protein